ncbi:MAG: sugar O-acetyltransferase [Dorea sp.]|jgi:Acetyltransferase (isoleucine patch superfamily)|nr:sugar O-acetyltransferase [Dorea sp.]
MIKQENFEKSIRYGPGFDDNLLAKRAKADELYFIFNNINPTNVLEKEKLLKELLPNMGENIVILSPFYTDYGYNCIIGDNTFINHNAYLMDGTNITIGKNCFIGPNCGMYTVNHPLAAEERNKGYEITAPISIGDNVWIGADVTILPGVAIGDNSVIGAKSLVTKSIPANVIAVGSPCEILRAITENDKRRISK